MNRRVSDKHLLSFNSLVKTSEQDSMLLGLHNRNEELNIPKPNNLNFWAKQHIIPWGPFLDLFIVLLFIFFALTYQTCKIHFFLNFKTIFDTYFMDSADDDGDGITLLYFKSDVIDNANASAQKFFQFVDTFPSQDPISEASNLSMRFTFDSARKLEYTVTRENLTLVHDFFEMYISDFQTAVMSVNYLLSRKSGKTEFLSTITYSITFQRLEGSGIIQWSSDFVGTNTAEKGRIVLASQLSVTIIPIALLIADIFALLMNLSRLISFIKHAREYAKKNYITLYKAIVWKVDGGELFNLFYQIMTMLSITLFIKYVGYDYGKHENIMLFVSFSGLIHCIGLFMHLKLKKETWFVARLIYKSIGRTLMFVFGFLPFFFSFVFMGISLFGHFSELFLGILRSMKNIFSLMHTDICMDNQDQLNEHAATSEWIVTCFTISWLMITGGMVINILIAIVENTLEELIKEEEE